jgi:hypothetical protein
MEATLSANYSVRWDRRCSQAIYPPRNRPTPHCSRIFRSMPK